MTLTINERHIHVIAAPCNVTVYLQDRTTAMDLLNYKYKHEIRTVLAQPSIQGIRQCEHQKKHYR
jgi:hypothetical protein